MAYFKCTGGLNPTGNAVAGDVKSGKTFSNASGVDLTGTFAAQTKTVTSSRTAQTVTPDSGKYLSKVTVNALAPTGTYTASSRGASLDMGETSNYRYVNTNSVPNTNSGTYTFAANDTGSKKDLGATNTYRYVDATNVYKKGKADGATSASPANMAQFGAAGFAWGAGYGRSNASTISVTGQTVGKVYLVYFLHTTAWGYVPSLGTITWTGATVNVESGYNTSGVPICKTQKITISATSVSVTGYISNLDNSTNTYVGVYVQPLN